MTLLEVPEAVFQERYEKVPFKLRHPLEAHPAFSLVALRALALRLPRADVLHRRGEVALDAHPLEVNAQAALDLSLEETFDRLQESNGYIVLASPERDAAFRPVADALMRDLLELDDTITGFSSRLIIAAGNSVAPFQLEHGHGVHLQVHGRQLASVWDPSNPDVFDDVVRERVLANRLEVVPWRDELFLSEQRFEVFPGEALHEPFIAPHLWRTCEEPSVSWHVVFHNERTEACAAVHTANGWLRRLGVEPRPHGVSAAVDFAKALGVRMYRTVTGGESVPPVVLAPES